MFQKVRWLLSQHLERHIAKFLNKGSYNVLNKKHLLVACMPKSGSTFLAFIISKLNGFKQVHLVNDYDHREQELDTLKLIRYSCYNYVAQNHLRYSRPTQNLMEQFGIMPIVLVRNLYDVTVSFRDHFRNESTVAAMGYALPYMKDWPDEQLEEFIVDLFIPWYFNFFVSWHQCSNKLMLTYEELAATPDTAIDKINKYYNLGLSDIEINKAIESAQITPTRKNVAKSGRGEHLNDYCKNRINLMAKYYTGIDFSIIGILN